MYRRVNSLLLVDCGCTALVDSAHGVRRLCLFHRGRRIESVRERNDAKLRVVLKVAAMSQRPCRRLHKSGALTEVCDILDAEGGVVCVTPRVMPSPI